MTRVWAVAVAVLLQAAGPSMRSIDRGAQSGIQTERRDVIRSAAAWATLWRAHAGDRPAPAVDFSREMVVAMFAGSRPTAGYAIEIVSVGRENGALTVQYRESAPPSDAMVAEMLTAPFDLAAVPSAPGEARFTRIPN